MPTSVFALILLPIAYLSFFLLFNQRKLLGDARPQGASLMVWNILMGATLVVVVGASGFMPRAVGSSRVARHLNDDALTRAA